MTDNSPPTDRNWKILWKIIKQNKWKVIFGAGTLCFAVGTIWWWIRVGKNKLTLYLLQRILGSEFRDLEFDLFNDSSSPLTLFNRLGNDALPNTPPKNIHNQKNVNKEHYFRALPKPTTTYLFNSLHAADLTTQNMLPLLLQRIKAITNVQGLLDQIRALHVTPPPPPNSLTHTTTSTSTPVTASSSSSETQQTSPIDRMERKQQLWQQLKITGINRACRSKKVSSHSPLNIVFSLF
jgi:hypothetical protein